ncbi:hypothetical protein M427DRAFT_60845 [Gonapodya prolifera JEL478]|uniref:EF-hand domain-containing protein n=1 Tax=Gonapodya prolifera (strain JEL478) TaxID=1344416 RepID=A0A139A3S4_GONPJ|nr:hypothetical protein M427DRAFT_60845 [Gonapodya prolifera JEL478]|eukprot:KXS11278.1 hypothetical protein M427DRAFT_60845 [Gonapodya prolifera JEL478]
MQLGMRFLLSFIVLVAILVSDFVAGSGYTHGSRMEHILEHLPGGDKPTSFSADEQIYVMYILHDLDKDGKLDGIELRAMLADSLPHGSHADKLTLEEADQLVEQMLESDDLDNDGKISWPEYLTSIQGK